MSDSSVPETYSNITELESGLFACRACPLREAAIGPTSYNGDPASPLMLIGEGPGGVEDDYGTPLVGPSGQLLDKALARVGITRDRVYTTNVVKCRPQGNRTPTVEEGEFCAARWLDAEIALVQPKVIVALGSVALKYLYHAKARITADRGKWFRTRHDIAAIATYHPAYLLRLTGDAERKAKWEVVHDLEAAIAEVQKTMPDWSLKNSTPPDLLALFADRKNARKTLVSSSGQE
ncbi:MAG TPA: uracil-DNA glycosylase [Negativicutes bacterium]|nr:uracil-DNA glycosylase [Negativicutes bacterium]